MEHYLCNGQKSIFELCVEFQKLPSRLQTFLQTNMVKNAAKSFSEQLEAEDTSNKFLSKHERLLLQKIQEQVV